ncbi:MAG: hypothetical protein H0U53_03885, partial [Actinobacteria bacterium]|nr:hypothetical protein [Actinomycetota bacterium]
LGIALLAGFLLASLVGPATAAKKSASYFLHGRGPVAEAYINETGIDSNFMTMDTTEPTAAEPTSIFVTRGFNTDCDGNGFLPVWKGDYAGKFKGTVTVTLHTIATPATPLVVSLYADATGTCSSGGTVSEPTEAPKPVATATVTPPSGPGVTEVVFKNVKFKALSNALLQLNVPSLTTPGQIRVLFDSAQYPSAVTFSK